MGEKTDLGTGGDVVIRLCEGILQNGNYKVSFDNAFTSHSLMNKIKSLVMCSIGTVRSNRIQK